MADIIKLIEEHVGKIPDHLKAKAEHLVKVLPDISKKNIEGAKSCGMLTDKLVLEGKLSYYEATTFQAICTMVKNAKK